MSPFTSGRQLSGFHSESRVHTNRPSWSSLSLWPCAFIHKAQRKASEEGFSASLLCGPSLPIISLGFCIFQYSTTIWWKPYRALRMLFTGNQPSGSSVWYMRWSWKPTTENAAASMRELKRILDSLKSHSQWLGEEDENPGFQHQVRSGTLDINIRHNAYSEGTKVLVVGH